MHVKIVQKITFVHHMFAIKIVMNRLKYAVGVLETVFANHLFLIECLMTHVKSKLAAAPELERSQ